MGNPALAGSFLSSIDDVKTKIRLSEVLKLSLPLTHFNHFCECPLLAAIAAIGSGEICTIYTAAIRWKAVLEERKL